jgi:hypothetical protein
MNGGKEFVRENGNQITFVSSLLSMLPMLELAELGILLWRSGIKKGN